MSKRTRQDEIATGASVIHPFFSRMRWIAAAPLVILAFAIALQTRSCALAAASQGDMPPDSLVNIALHRLYTLTPPPNYPPAANPGDTTNLTDGRFVASAPLWNDNGAVSWQYTNAVITLDLGAVQPIRGAAFDTAGGSAGGHWPSDLFVLASDDGISFHELGSLIALSRQHGAPPEQGYGRYEYWTDALKGHGRYVSFVVFGYPLISADEIQVFRGDPGWLNDPNPGAPVPNNAAAWYSLKRVTTALDSVRTEAHSLASHSGARDVAAALNEFQWQPAAAETQARHSFVRPIESAADEARVLQMQAKLWKAAGAPDLKVWQSNRWDPLSITAVPPLTGSAAIDMEMMRGGEYRSAAFNVSNAAQNDAIIRLTITGLPGGVNPSYITPYEVEWTDSPNGPAVATELLKAELTGGSYVIHVPSGLTRQVWFTFHPVGVAPGDYTGAVHLEGARFSAAVPVRLHIYPISFPTRTTLHLGGWDYTNNTRIYGVTSENRAPLVQALQSHLVDSPWATKTVMPSGDYGPDGAMTQPPDTAEFDRWIKLWPDAAQYCVAPDSGSSFGGSPLGTPLFDRKVGEWIRFWANHAKTLGIAPGRLALLPVDEPHTPEQTARLGAWLKAINRAHTGVIVMEEPLYSDPRQAEPVLDQAQQLVEQLQLYIRGADAYKSYFERRSAAGQTIAFYDAQGPAMNVDPYAYYRLQAWICWREGAIAEYFWSFADSTLPTESAAALKTRFFSPLFLSQNSVRLSKQMEAIREGVEDYEYLAMLKDAAARSSNSSAASRARKLLNDAPRLVCDPAIAGAREADRKGQSDPFSWQNSVDRSAADRERVEVLNALAQVH